MQNELFRSVHKIVLKNKQNYILVYGFIVLLFFFLFLNTKHDQPNVLRKYLSYQLLTVSPHALAHLTVEKEHSGYRQTCEDRR